MTNHSSVVVVFVFLLALGSLAPCTQANILVASSSTYLGVWNILTASFNQLIPTASLPLKTMATYAAINELTHGGATVTLSEMSLYEMKAANQNPQQTFPNAFSVPFLFQAYNVIYNVPGLPISYHLVLNAEALSGIFLNQITRWNDSLLVQLNPILGDLNITEEIRLVHRKTEGGTTNVFTRCLSALSPEWGQRYGPVSNWPTDLILNNSLLSDTGHVFAISGFVQANNYSLAFISMSYYVGSIGSLSAGLNYAYFLTDDNKLIIPNATTVRNAISAVTWSRTENVSGLAYNPYSGLPSWPITGIGYIIINNTIEESQCKDQRNVLRFLNWAFASGPASTILDNNGYYIPPSSVVSTILRDLSKIDCNNDKTPLLSPTTSVSSRVGQIVVVALFPILIVSAIILSIIYNKKSRIAMTYSFALVLALVFMLVSMIMWVLEPVNSSICRSRWWFMGLGLSLVSGSVYARSYQLKKIHQLIKEGLYKSTKRLNHVRMTGVVLGTVVLSAVVLLLVLELVIPFESEVVLLDSIRRTGEYQCVSHDMISWIASMTGYLFVVLFLGIWAMYSTWNISSTVDDTRVNILMIFVCIVVVIVADNVLLSASSNRDDYDQSWWAIIIQALWGLSITASVFLPKFVKSYYKSSSNNNNNSNGTAGDSTKSATITRKHLSDNTANTNTINNNTSNNNNSNINNDSQQHTPKKEEVEDEDKDKQQPMKKKRAKKGAAEVVVN